MTIHIHKYKSNIDHHFGAEVIGEILSDKTKQELLNNARSAQAEIDKTIDIGAFLLSDDALNRLEQYKKEAYKAAIESAISQSSFENANLAATMACINDFIEIAKKDLKYKLMEKRSEGIRRIVLIFSVLSVISWILFVGIESERFVHLDLGVWIVFILAGIAFAFYIPIIICKVIYWVIDGFNKNKIT